jgi:hypothetical protein
MARKKTAADEAYNVRRRARRLAARLEKEAASLTGRRREVAQRRAAGLREQIERTYVRNGVSRGAREEAFSKLAREVTQRSGRGKRLGSKSKKLQQAARNRAFALQLSNALNYDTITGKGIPSSLARDPEMARSMALLFMHAHTDIRREQYDLHTPQNIYNEIMKAHGTSDLQQAFLQTMRENKAALQDMFRALKDEADGGEQKYEAVRPYLSMVHQQPRFRA